MVSQLGHASRKIRVVPLLLHTFKTIILNGELHIITQSELKKLLHYNPETGALIWLVSNSNRVKAGSIAGHISRYGYIQIRVNKTLYAAHRIVWLYVTGFWPKDQIDHINHIRDDNRWVNLREVTNQENAKNQGIRKDSVSGVTGVCWDKRGKVWCAYINVGNKQPYLGRFNDKFEAICFRKSAENKCGFHENHGR